MSSPIHGPVAPLNGGIPNGGGSFFSLILIGGSNGGKPKGASPDSAGVEYKFTGLNLGLSGTGGGRRMGGAGG